MSSATSYVASLPRGLDSYEGCLAKGSLINAFLAGKPLDAEKAHPSLRFILERKVRTNEWVPETHFLTLSLMIRERHFHSDESFLTWVKALNAQLFSGPVYRALMFVATTRLLVAGASMRWRQFHQGTTLTAEHQDGNSVEFRFKHEPNHFLPLHVRLFLAAIEAALEATGAQRCETVGLETTATEARAYIRW